MEEHIENLIACSLRIKPYVHRTPILRSGLINRMAGASLYFKCENFQRMGAYKMRGATNAVMQLSDEQKARGVVTHSSGNFAQALSLAAKSLGIEAHIVMPENAPQVKVDAVMEYGGKVYRCESTTKAREQMANELIKSKGLTFLHPSDDIDVIYGQGTACLELLEDHPDLDCVVCPVGGGGLIAGSAIAIQAMNSDAELIGAEPFEVDDAYRSLQSGKIEFNETTNTIADGLKTHLGEVNFPIIKDHVSRIIRVEEEEIIQAMKMIYERMKIVVEPSSAVTLAAVIRESDYFKDRKVGIIISGGNVDLARLPF